MPEEPATDVPFYRLSVGMRNGYDFMGGLQFSLLFALGLREEHRVCDVGCGSLRAGRLLLPYLAPGNYCGIEPRREVLEEGITHEIGPGLIEMREPRFDYGEDFGLERFGTTFDYVLAQSVFSHTYRDLATLGLAHISAALAPDGLFVGTVYEEFPVLLPRGANDRPDDGSGFLHQGAVAYTWREWTALLAGAGLVGHRIRWYHNRQTWFVATHRGGEARVKDAARGATRRLEGPGFLGHVQRRAVARLRRR
jgi:SAM-dependent methyltransferase